MILIWSGEGGPLQWLGIIVFILQFFAPQIFRLSLEIQDGTLSIDSFPLVWLACSLAIALVMGGLWVAWDFWSSEEQQEDEEEHVNVNEEDNNETPAESSGPSAQSGTASNPVVVDDNGDDDAWIRAWTRINSMLQSFSPTHLMLALGFILPLAMTAPLFLNALQNEELPVGFANSGIIQITVLAILAVTAHSIMAIAAYRVLRDVLDSAGGVGPYPGTRQGRRRRLRRKLTVSELVDIVRKVPVEEFVSEDDVRTGSCSIGRMKRMLANRGASEASEKCVERDDLAKEVEKVRKFNEDCAICAEEYVEGDVLRVSHCCKNEFHLHCFDKWIYTFSTDSRPNTHPTCPLCKATIQ
mmetsp:Transcript_8347/g.18705  ORF Transcript_8347/g.18705 Transcript_8347/m.18705 type:complete len:355 (+) Transcript_8347:99-1163(+)